MDGSQREMKAKVWNVSGRKLMEWAVMPNLLADNTILFAGSEEDLLSVEDKFHSLCTRRKLKVNVGKNNVMIVMMFLTYLSYSTLMWLLIHIDLPLWEAPRCSMPESL